MKLVSRQLTLNNQLGLHLRPAAEISRIASHYDAEVHLHKEDQRANVQSVLELMILGIRQGDLFEISGQGEHADAAVSEIADFLDAYRDVEVGPGMLRGRESDSYVA